MGLLNSDMISKSTDRISSNRNDFHTKKKTPQSSYFDSEIEINFVFEKSQCDKKLRTEMLQNVNVKCCCAFLAFITCFSVLFRSFSTLRGGLHYFKKPTSQCDIPKNAKNSPPFVKGLGGGPVCFYHPWYI